MKLTKTYFNLLKINDECIFRNEKKEIIHCKKINKNKIYAIPIKEIHRTGSEHECHKIEDKD
jgi:hypothetical protein